MRLLKIASSLFLFLLAFAIISFAVGDSPNHSLVVSVAAEDKTHNPVADLSAKEFSLKVDGVPVPVSSVAYAGRDPVDWLLLIDSSNSMRTEELWKPSIGAAVQQVSSLITERGDRVAVAVFSDKPGLLQELTTDPGQIEAAISRIQPSGATALYDSLVSGFGYLSKHSPPEHRKIIWVITDGGDNQSSTTLDEVRESASGAGVPLFFSIPGSSQRTPASDEENALVQLARASGGAKLHSGSKKECTEVAKEIVTFSRKMYRIDFAPASAAGNHKIEVATSRPKVKLLGPKQTLRFRENK